MNIEWLEKVYELDRQTDKHRFNAAYILQSNLNRLMIEGEFQFIDDLIHEMRVWEISVEFMIGLLVCSRWCQDKLIHRDMFYKRVKAELIDRGRTDVNELLMGLE